MERVVVSRLTPTKAASTTAAATGVFRGRIVAVADHLVDVEVPRLTGPYIYREVEVVYASLLPMLAVGDAVYVAFVEGFQDQLVVIGPVRPPARWIDGELGLSGFNDPLEEYVATRDGTLTVGHSFIYPVRRSATIQTMMGTLTTAGSTDTIVDLELDGLTLATLTIPAGDTVTRTPVEVSVTSGELLRFNVREAGTSAVGLLVVARGRVASSSLPAIDEYAFGQGGAVALGRSERYPLRRDTTFSTIIATLGVVGANDVVVDVELNGTPFATVTIPTGQNYVALATSRVGLTDQLLTINVTDAAVGAADLGVFVRGAG